MSISVQTKRPIEMLEELKGVYDISKQGETVMFQIDQARMDNIIKHISEFEL